MKKTLRGIISALLLAGAIFSLSACGEVTVADDLIAYSQSSVTEALEKCATLSEAGQKVSEMENPEDAIAYLKENVAPLIDEAKKTLSTITPETEEVKKLHEKLINSVDTYGKGIDEFIKGIEEDSVEGIEKSGETLNQGATLMEEFTKEYDALATENGLKTE